MQNVSRRLEDWREAERRRDRLPDGSPQRQEAEELVRTARRAFHAELAQASARYAEQEFRYATRGWSAPFDRLAVSRR